MRPVTTDPRSPSQSSTPSPSRATYHEPRLTIHEHENENDHVVSVRVLVLVDREKWLVKVARESGS